MYVHDVHCISYVAKKKMKNQAYEFAGEDVLVLMFLDLTDQDWFLRKECITLLIILLSAQKWILKRNPFYETFFKQRLSMRATSWKEYIQSRLDRSQSLF